MGIIILRRNYHCLIILGTLWCSLATAQVSNTDILQVQYYYDSVEYEKAIAIGNALRKARIELTAEDLAFLHRYMGLAYYNAGQPDSARTHFLSLLSIRPATELDPAEVSPKIIEFFSRIKAAQGDSAIRPGIAYNRYILTEDLRPNAVWRSAIVPGWGQVYKGQAVKGVALSALFLGNLTAALISRNRAQEAEEDYLNAVTPQDITSKYESFNRWHRRRQVFAWTTVSAWALALIDANWSSPVRPTIQPEARRQDLSLKLGFRVRF